MDKKIKKELKINFIKQVTTKPLVDYLRQLKIDKHNFSKGQVSVKKVDELFELVYEDLAKNVVRAADILKDGISEDKENIREEIENER